METSSLFFSDMKDKLQEFNKMNPFSAPSALKGLIVQSFFSYLSNPLEKLMYHVSNTKS